MPTIDFTLIGLPGWFSRTNISDEEASKLYEIWYNSPPGGDLVVANVDVKDLEKKELIKVRGLQEGARKYALTPKGREIIVELVTNVGNAFDKDAPRVPSYKKIRTKAKTKDGHTFKKHASLESRYDVQVEIEGFDDTKDLK